MSRPAATEVSPQPRVLCAPPPQLFGDWEAQMRRVLKMIAGGGLSITGSHNMCGDYLYSGHTVMLTLTYLFIKECEFSPPFKRRALSWLRTRSARIVSFSYNSDIWWIFFCFSMKGMAKPSVLCFVKCQHECVFFFFWGGKFEELYCGCKKHSCLYISAQIIFAKWNGFIDLWVGTAGVLASILYFIFLFVRDNVQKTWIWIHDLRSFVTDYSN